MDEAARQALAPTPDGGDRVLTVDITTYGAKSGKPRRIEIWIYQLGGTWYLSGSPGPRDWYANVVANPDFEVHLKGEVSADLSATARPITERSEREQVFTELIKVFKPAYADWGGGDLPPQPEWVERSPLAQITFRS